jgi:aminopeptidase
MKKALFISMGSSLAVFILGLLSAAPACLAQGRDFDELAHRIVSTAVNIKPGEVVVISGGKHTVPLMEALAIEAQNAGGMVTMFLGSDKVIRSFNADVPEKYLEQEPRFFAEWLRQVDVWISLPDVSDIQALDVGVPAARLAKIDKANQFLTPLLDSMKIRQVNMIYPTDERARYFGLDGATYVNMIWDAIGADYKQISDNGRALQKAFQGAKTVRVTSPSGTDLTLQVGNRPIFLEEGIISEEKAKSKSFIDRTTGLPAGTLTFAPPEDSARGKVVVPRAECRYEAMTSVSFEFKKGKMEDFKAGKGGNCFHDLMSASSGPTDQIGSLSIGLNPAWKVHEENDAHYYPNSGAGVVFVNIGDNQLLGGKNKTQGNFSFGFPLVGATVEVDGKVVIKNGTLVI